MKYVLAALVLTAITGCAFAVDQAPVLVYPCFRAENPITVDGRLDEPEWNKAPIARGFVYYNRPELASVQTAFRVLYDDTALYIGIQCDEPLSNKLRRGEKGLRDEWAAVFPGEAIEVFIDPLHDHTNYFQIASSVSGTIYDGKGGDVTWNSKAFANGVVSEGQWTLEMSIPLADLGIVAQSGAVLGFNVCRDRNLGDTQWTTWGPVTGGFHDPSHFGHLVLSPTPEMIGKLCSQLRFGGLSGPLRVYGPDEFCGQTYLELARFSVKEIEATLTEIEIFCSKENSADTVAVLKKKITDARNALAPVTEGIQSKKLFSTEEWTRTDRIIQQLRDQFKEAIAEARLEALLKRI